MSYCSKYHNDGIFHFHPHLYSHKGKNDKIEQLFRRIDHIFLKSFNVDIRKIKLMLVNTFFLLVWSLDFCT